MLSSPNECLSRCRTRELVAATTLAAPKDSIYGRVSHQLELGVSPWEEDAARERTIEMGTAFLGPYGWGSRGS